MATTQRAFEAAMLDFKDKLKGHSFYDQIVQTTSIEQVYQDIKNLQDKQAKSDRLRNLSKIEPFLARLREYSSVVETFVQAKPDILALIWGPIKLLLLWADVTKQSFDALVNALEEVGNALPDFCELAEMFAGNNRLQQLLALYFRDILEFYLISTKYTTHKTDKGAHEADDILGNLDGNAIDIEVDKNNAGSIQVFINQTMREWFKDRGFVSDVRDQLQGWAASLAYRAQGMFLYVKVIFRMIYYVNDIGDIKAQLENLPPSLEDAYIFDTEIKNSITLSEMALELAIRCVVYMCQDHHDSHLTEDEIDANIIWGAYRLHHFSSNFWLDLIHEYLTLSGSETIPDSLIDQLRILFETRSSDHYIETDQSESRLHPAILGLEFQEPALVQMLKSCSEFQTSSLKSDFQLNDSEQWFHTSPLYIPEFSILLHRRLDGFVNKGHSIIESLSYHYGPRYFKCGFLGCKYRRYGFETKASRQAHEKHHQKPWNCDYPGCRYVSKGFVSRKMRDYHLKHGHTNVHAIDPHLPHAGLPEEFEDEEIQPLMFDLIHTDQVAIIMSLIPRLAGVGRSVQREFSIHAARMGSYSILQLFHRCGLLTSAFMVNGSLNWKAFSDLAGNAIQSESVSLSKLLLCWITAQEITVQGFEKGNFQLALKDILWTIIEVKSQELFDLWKLDLATGFGVIGAAADAAQGLAFQAVIARTDNIPNCERMLLDIWDEFRVLDTIKPRERSKILSRIADSSCPISLTQYALNHGCLVDGRYNSAFPTALHVAARRTTREAANLMEFLLLQGADPNKGTKTKRIGDEKGAQQVSKWLGLTWEQLVEKATETRQRNEKKENEDSYSD
ncbi:Nacht domain [Fusarium agapanthi]|uniref:Nacht domain n=1 Tax=Fusarium agapanthi TaxID=1803897 RepID=A0A9P5EA73_9HYPO|nr:Nacht domain [Fusarium agapanthi]